MSSPTATAKQETYDEMPDPLEVAPLRLASPDERKVGKKHTRHASDKNTPPDETQPGDQSANPVGVGAAQMGDFDSANIAREPRFLAYGLRQLCYDSLGSAVVAFKDKDAFSVDMCGFNSVSGIIFWCVRIRTHLAPGLGEVPEELAFDPCSADFSYDVRQALGRFEEMDRLIQGGMLQSKYAEGFCAVFMGAWEEVVNLKMAIVAKMTKAAMVRPGALGKVRSRDPHFGKKSVRLYTPTE